METPTAHMHVGWAVTFDPPEDRPPPTFEQLREHIARRLPRAPRYRQMIRPVPLGLGAPAWVDDERFDISRHVFRAESRSLAEVVDESMSEPLERDRPLWEVHVAERLDDGRVGLVGKAHHCMVDGIAAVELASLLVDPEPDAPEPLPDDWSPEEPPGDASLISGALVDFAREQLALVRLPAWAAGSPRRVFEVAERASHAASALVDSARPARADTALNPQISPERHLGLLDRPVEDLLRAKRAFGVTLNDVVLAAAAGGMRRFLKRRGEDPVRLKSMVPVNVRETGEGDELGNRISFMFVDLPCDEPDPIRRLRALSADTSERKRTGRPEGANTILRSVGRAPTLVRSAVSRLVASPRTFNLVVSNIPGPRQPLYMRGCRLAEAYPVVPIADRHALSIGMTTVGDRAFFGLYADPESLPDVDALPGCMEETIDELLHLAADAEALEVATPVAPVG